MSAKERAVETQQSIVNRRCPHCGMLVEIRFDANLNGINKSSVESLEETFTPVALRALEIAEATGVYQAFADALPRIRPQASPKNPRRFFLRYLDSVQPILIPREDLDLLRRWLGNGWVEVVQAQGVGMVLVDKAIRAFVPVIGRSNRRDIGGTMLADWVRSKHGYCPKGPLLEVLRSARSVGDFARVVTGS